MHPLKTGEEPLFLRVRNARQLFGRQLKHDRLTGGPTESADRFGRAP